MIIANGITYKIGDSLILNSVSAEIDTGELTAVLGPNGAGKSSLLKCITGAVKPNTGSIYIDNKNIHDCSLEELSKTRAVLSQQNAISFPFSAMEIVLMGRHPFNTTHETKEDIEVAEQVLKQVDAYHLKDRSYPSLSGGEQQRVQLARVLAQICEEGKYLFLDEPTSSLDLKHQYMTLQIAKKHTEKGIGVFCILHDLNLAAQFADKIILMKAGKVFKSGKTKEVCEPQILSEVFEINITDIANQRYSIAA